VWAASLLARASSSRSRVSSTCARSSAARSRATIASVLPPAFLAGLPAFPLPSRRSSSASSRSRAAIASARSRSDCFSRSSSELASAWPVCRFAASSRASRRSSARSRSASFSSWASPRRRGVHESKLSSQRSISAPSARRPRHHGARFRSHGAHRFAGAPAGSCAGRISRKQAPCGNASS
jgi:hypothetical protein